MSIERWRALSPDLEELTSAFALRRPLEPARAWAGATASIVAMAVTATLRAHGQLGWHVRGALGRRRDAPTRCARC